MIFFLGDTHFNHEAIIRHAGRRYASVAEMNASLMTTWNSVVTSERDEVWHLGDFGFHAQGAEDLAAIWWRLRGRKSLVVGNHDVKNPQVLRLPWERVETLFELKTDGRRVVLCHYPLESWPGMHYGAVHLHGHCHGTLAHQIPHRFDVGVDVVGAPVSLDAVVERAAAQRFVPQDHHGR